MDTELKRVADLAELPTSPTLFQKPRAVRPLNPFWIGGAVAACLAAAVVYGLVSHDYRQTTQPTDELPNASALDNSLRESDKGLKDDAYTEKIKSMKLKDVAIKTLLPKQPSVEPGSVDYYLFAAHAAILEFDWLRARDALAKARTHPHFNDDDNRDSHENREKREKMGSVGRRGDRRNQR